MAELSVKFNADGRAFLQVVRDAQAALGGLGVSAEGAGQSVGAVGRASTAVSATWVDLGRGAVAFTALSAAANGAVAALAALPRSGIEFAANMETMRIGMAGVLSSMTAVNGQNTSYVQGLAVATDMTEKLQRDAMLTAASTQELVGAFQAMVGPGLAAGMSLDQIRQLATTGVNAVKSLGMAGSQVVQELRDLVQGGITASSSTLATALGLKDKDIAEAKASSEGLFAFLMGRMKGFTEASTEYSKTFKGAMDQLQEQLVQSSAKMFEPLQAVLKEQAQGITQALGNEEQIKSLQGLTRTIELVGKALGGGAQFALQHAGALTSLVTAYSALRIGARVGEWAQERIALSGAAAATREKANNELAATVVRREYIAAELAAAQAQAANMAGMQRLGYVQQTVIPLQQQHAQVVSQVAIQTNLASIGFRAASVAAGAMGSVFAALGGPVGIAIAAVTLLIGKLMDMRGEAQKTAFTALAKERVDAAVTRGEKADDRDVAALSNKVNDLKNRRDQLILDIRTAEKMQSYGEADYSGAARKELDAVQNQISVIESAAKAAEGLSTQVGAQIRLQGGMATQQIDQLLDKYKTASQLSHNAAKEKAALDVQMANLKNSNAPQQDVAAKEREVAEAKKLIESKLQEDLKGLREKGAADVNSQVNAQFALFKGQQEQQLAQTRQALQERELANELALKKGIVSEGEYFAQRKSLAVEDLSAQEKTILADMAKAQSQLVLRARGQDRIAVEEKLVALGTKMIVLQTQRNKIEGEEALRIAEKALQFKKAQEDSETKALDALHAQVQGLRDANAAMVLHNAEIGLTTEQLNALRLERLDSEITIQAGIVAEYNEARALGEVTAQMQLQINKLDELKKKRGLTADGQQAQVAADAAKKAADEWKKTADKIESALTDALMRGFEGGKGFGENLRDTLTNMFKTMVLRPVIQAAVQPMAGAVQNAIFGGGAGGANTLSNLSNLSSLSNFFDTGGSVLGGLAGTSASYGAALGTTSVGAGSQAAMLAAQTAEFGTAGLSATAGAAGSGAMASVAAAAPYIAAALAVYQLAKTLDTSGTIHTGGSAAYSASGGVQTNIGAGRTGFAYTDRRTETEEMAAGMAKSIVGLLDTTATAFGKTAGYTAATAFADDSSRDGAWGALVLSKGGKDLLNWADTRQSRWAPREFADGQEGVKQYMAAVSKDVRDMLIAETPEWADSMLRALGDAPTLEQLSGVVQQITAIQNVFKQFGDSIPQLKGLSDEAVGSLMSLAGGVGNLQQGLATYQNLFYTEAEKQAFATKQVADAMANLGLAMPENDVAYRKLVEAQDVNTEAGRRQWTALIALAPAFEQVTAAAKKAAEAAIAEAQARAKAIADERAGLQNQLDQAMGNTAALRERERNALDQSNRALYDQIKALELQKTAAEAAAAVDQERQGLQDQIDQMMGNTTALRMRERAALSESNRALYDHIKAIEDQRAAAQAAVDAARAGSDAAMRALQAAVTAEKAQWDATLRTAQGRVSDLTGLLSSITRTVADLLREATAVPVSRAQGQAWLDAAVSTAKAGGQLPTEAKLSEVVQGLRQSMGQTMYKSQVAEDRDKLLLAIKLNDLGAVAGGQLSDAEKQLQAAQTQITRLDDLLRAQQAQLDAARGNAASTLSVADAIKAMDRAVTTEIKALAEQASTQLAGLWAAVLSGFASMDTSQDGLLSSAEFMSGMAGKATDSELSKLFAMLDANGDGQISQLEAVRGELIKLREKWVTTGSGAAAVSTYTSTGGAVATQTSSQKPTGAATITDITGASYSTQDVIKFVNQQLAAGNPRSIYDEAVKRGISSTSLDRIMGWSAGTALKWATDNQLPAFAEGGSYKGGLALVGERGPELINFAQPGQVYNAQQTQQILGGGGQSQAALLQEVRALRNEVQGLRYEARATALHASKTADILDRVTQGDDALRSREVPA